MFNVSVDSAGQVQKAIPDGGFEPFPNGTDLSFYTDLIKGMTYTLFGESSQWHNDTIARNWLNRLLQVYSNEDYLDPQKPLPNLEEVSPKVEQLYKLLFSVYLGRNVPRFRVRGLGFTVIDGTKTKVETRIFLSIPAFLVSITVLSLNILMAAIIYGFQNKPLFPRMPTTIGSILAYVAPSRAIREYSPTKLGPKSRTFSYGRYVGEGKKAQLGIEMDPFVVPIPWSSINMGRGSRFSIRRFWRRGTSDENWI
jgi:hypothetical protein